MARWDASRTLAAIVEFWCRVRRPSGDVAADAPATSPPSASL
jgi:hypothetical protein